MTTRRASRAPLVTQQRTKPVYVSIEEAATMMSMSTVTIRRRISDGSIPAYKCGGRLIRIRVDDLEAAMRRIPTVGADAQR